MELEAPPAPSPARSATWGRGSRSGRSLNHARPGAWGAVQGADGILAYLRERNRFAGIKIHTIGLSGDQDAYLMVRLAEENGGQYAAR